MSKSSHPKVHRIAAVTPFVGDGKEILLGISSALASMPHWVLRPINVLTEMEEEELLEWDPDGAILFGDVHPPAAALSARKVPFVRVLHGANTEKCSTVDVDNDEVGRLAAGYFLGRGHRNFAYVGNQDIAFSTARKASYVRHLEAAGFSAEVYLHPSAPAARASQKPIMNHAKLGKWLKKLPKPVAVFASNDWDALEISQTCILYGIDIPQQVSLLGVGNDELACRVARPELSSIRLPLREVAGEAVAILRQTMDARNSPPMRSVVMHPQGLITRASTQFFPVNDPLVGDALAFMAENLGRPLQISRLLKHFRVSRTVLEKRFRLALGRTPLVELRRQRIERAKTLLVDTDLPMKNIGRLSGFSSEIRFATVFREITGKSPSEFRTESQS